MEPTHHHLVVPRTARYLTIGDSEAELDQVWFVLHGYGQLATEIAERAGALASSRRLLVVPEALSRFYHDDHETVGASWMTREDRLSEIDDYVRYLDLVHDAVFQLVDRDAVTLGVLGFSQGAATAARWAVRGQGDVNELVIWGSALPPELDDEASLAAFRSIRLTLVAGERDRFFTEDKRQTERERLADRAVSFRERTFAGGHRLDDETLRSLSCS